MRISIYDVNDEPIGRGGMGQVYLGTDAKGNKLAIKEMNADFVADSNLRARFHQEINILSKLDHRSIVKMYASFEERGNLYLVMEYVEGETIAQYVKRRGPIEETKSIIFLLDILSALGYAHQRGYVHRDIKPSNIIIRPDESICLLDFGIAKDLNRTGGLTVGQLSIGTDGYMSPEQAEGYNIDQRSDIYSLGSVLFYMLTGRHAISKQKNDFETRMSIIGSDFPKAQQYNPSISDNLQEILDKATHKNMLLRFQSCREFELEVSSNKTVVDNPNHTHIITIGRENCTITMSHPKVSRHHADVERINYNGYGYLFKDRSANGTVIDGEKIHNGIKEIYPKRNGKKPIILLAGVVQLDWNSVEGAFGHQYPDMSEPSGHDTNPPTAVPESSSNTGQYTPQSATGWLVAIYIFAVLGGFLGLVFGISVYKSKVEFANGQKTYKYKKNHRNAALIGAILSSVSIIIWNIIMQ